MFQSKNRFDYTQIDVDNFHHTAEIIIKPIVTNIYRQKAKLMGKEKLKPRDLKFDPLGNRALKPYDNSKELVDKTAEIL
jgi:oligoendopeptidase F